MSRKQAYLMISKVVDDEVSKSEKKLFFEFIKNHPDIYEEYENVLHIKMLFSSELKKIKAPPHLRKSIEQELQRLEIEKVSPDQKLNKQNRTFYKTTPFWKYTGAALRYFSAIAIFIVISIVIFQILNHMDHAHQLTDELMVEQAAVQHFGDFSMKITSKLFSSDKITEAQQYLTKQHNFNATVPKISGTVFNGIVLAHFRDDFSTPMLEYEQKKGGEKIYLFVFDIDSINNRQTVYRHNEAVKHCVTSTDYYVAEIGQYHVVTWVWGNYWYSAVSNQNGNDLASLIEPLNK